MTSSEPLLAPLFFESERHVGYCLDPSRSAIDIRQSKWIQYLRSVCQDDAAKWRNKCSSMLRRIRRIRETMHRSITQGDRAGIASLSPSMREQRLQSAIEEYSIQTGLDYDQSRTVIDASPHGEKGGTGLFSPARASLQAPTPELMLRRFLEAATPVPQVPASGSTPIDAAFGDDERLAESRSPVYGFAVWLLSRSLWEVFASIVISFSINQSFLAGGALILMTTVALPSFPYPPHVLWRVLLLFFLVVIAAKLAWQLPIICDTGADPSSPWYLIFYFATEYNRHGDPYCPPVYLDSRAMRLGLYKSTPLSYANYSACLHIVWTELLCVFAIIIHMRSLSLSGRSLLLPRQAREAISGSPFESATTRPTWDTYSARFFLSLVVAVLLITDWSSVSATRLPSVSSTPSLLGESFTRIHFSAWQVVAITVFIFQIILDRCLYTLISHSPSVGTLSEEHQEFNTRTTFHRKLVLASVTVQFVLLVVAMNLRLVNRFFIPYCMYLVLTARQLAFDIRPVGGKTGGILWSPGSMSYYAFRLYLAIPFLDELRQICDWVASPSTCLSLYMWFKVEDCMQNLRFVQAEMDSRGTLPLTRGDRSCVGVSAIVGLVAIITGPLVFFSGLNVLREQNPIVSTVPGEPPSSLRIFLQAPPNVPHLTLYTSSQLATESISTETVKDEVLAPLLVMKSADLQRISFPEASDSQWAISDILRSQLMEALTGKSINVSVTAEWTLARQLSPFTTSLTATSSVSSKALMDAIQAAEVGSVDVPNLIPSVAYLDSSPFAKVISEEGVRAGTQLKLSKDHGEWWNLIDPDRQGILCLGERTMGTGSTPGSGGSSYTISVIGLYIGVVLTVGRFLRLSMQGSSKRIGVEELASTETPMQICQGIHIARLFKDVETERKLYYDLVKLFRDPELLLAATGAASS